MTDVFAQHVAVWDRLADEDPFWAVLSDPAKRGGGWDPEAFFADGREYLGWLEADLQGLGHSFARRRVLDFGCGLGRLTQAIAERAAFTIGVDASVGMVLGAQRWNRHSERCAYLLNRAPDLDMLPAASFGAVVSFIVIQHIPPPASHRYLADLARLVAPGGFLAVQIPSEEVVVDLPAPAFASQVRLVDVPRKLTVGTPAELTVEVANRSAERWAVRPARRLRVGNHWIGLDGGPSVLDDGRVAIDPLDPGAVRTVRLPVVAPSKPGRYRLEVDVVVESQAWFAQHGGEVGAADVRVVAPGWRAPAGPGPRADAAGLESFGMFGIAQPDVLRLLEGAGLQMLEVSPDGCCGEEWHSWRYIATRP